jgi:tripartite motif-containing protein 71
MASPRKKSSKRKLTPVAPPPVPVTAPVKRGGWFGKLMIGVILFLIAWEAFQLAPNIVFHSKSFPVTQVAQITSATCSCGDFSTWGVASVGKDRFIVSEQNHNSLMLFDQHGKFIKSWGKIGAGSEFHEPSGMTSDSRGIAYVVDTWNGSIKGFDQNGQKISSVNFNGKGFYGPRGIAYDGGNFDIADTGSHRVVVLSPEGSVVKIWGKQGQGKDKDQWASPMDVVADGNGTYYVADTGNNRVKKLDASGNVLKIFKMKNPEALAVDAQGRLYANFSDPKKSGVRVYGPKGDYLGDLRDEKDSDASFQFVRGMAVLPGNILVLTSGGIISVFQLPS